MRASPRAAAVVALALAGACFSRVELVGKKCDATHECPGDLVCIGGFCDVNDGGFGGGGGVGGGGAMGGGAAGGGLAGGGAAGGGAAGGGGAGGGDGGTFDGGICSGLALQPGFQLRGGLRNQRYAHTATLLPSCKLLIAGGIRNDMGLSTTEIYDPVTMTAEPGPMMNQARSQHVAVPLPDGRIVMAGGGNQTIELYDPTVRDGGAFTNAGCLMAVPRVLNLHGFWAGPPVSRVVLFGGDVTGRELLTELYDPFGDTCGDGGQLINGIYDAPAIQLTDGRLMVIAIYGQSYDPPTQTWNNLYPLTDEHNLGAAVALDDGGALVAAGGYTGIEVYSAAVLTPVGFRRIENTPDSRQTPLMGKLPSGNVLLATGRQMLADGGDDFTVVTSGLIYDFATEHWRDAGSMSLGHLSGSITELPGKGVIFCGGSDGRTIFANCETFVE